MWLTPELIDFDPDAQLCLLWIAPMSPKSQFLSAVGTVAIYLLKAAWNFVVHDRAFMFLRGQYEMEEDKPDLLFELLDLDDNNAISPLEWKVYLDKLRVPDAEQKAGFKAMDVGASGAITSKQFIKIMSARTADKPCVSHADRLATFCREALVAESGTKDLSAMLDGIFDQWQRISLEKLGHDLYQQLLMDASIRTLFDSTNMEAMAVMLGAFTDLGIRWLQTADVLSLERKMTELGFQHAKYKVKMRFVSSFLACLFQAMESQLGPAFKELQHVWAFVWHHYIFRPFLNGLRKGLGLSHQWLVKQAIQSSEELFSQECFIDQVLQTMTSMEPIAIEKLSESWFAAHRSVISNLLQELLSSLDLNKTAAFRSRVRSIAFQHSSRGIGCKYVAVFHEAFLRALCEFRFEDGDNSHEIICEAWAWILQVEFFEMWSLSRHSDALDKLELLGQGDWDAEVSEAQWMSSWGGMGISEEFLRAGYKNVISRGACTMADVKALLMHESFKSPQAPFQTILYKWCSKN